MRSKHPVFIKNTGETTFVFRAPYTKDELKSLLMLRYRIFRETKGDWVFCQNPYELDIDAYDLRAYHFGLFKCLGDRQICVGHMRLVVSDERDTYIAPLVREIADEIPDINPAWDTPPQYVLPHFQLIDEKVAWEITEQAAFDNHILIETSRYCTDTEAQAIAIARFMVSSVVEAAHHYFKNMGRVYVMVHYLHASFYKSYGFEIVQEIIPKGTDEKYVILTIAMNNVAEMLLLAKKQPTVPLHRLTFKKDLDKAA